MSSVFRCIVVRGTCIVEDPNNLSTKSGRILQIATGKYWVNTDRDEIRKKLIAKPVAKPVAKRAPVAGSVRKDTRGQKLVRVALDGVSK